MKSLTLPFIKHKEQRLRQRIGAGLLWYFNRLDALGTIYLSLYQGEMDKTLSYWQCESGVFALTEAETLLASLTDAPTFIATDTHENGDWFWSWWNTHLPLEITRLFGFIKPYTTTNQEDALNTVDSLILRFEVRISQQHICSVVKMSENVLEQLLNKNEWHCTNRVLPESLPMSFPIQIGMTVLSIEAILGLRINDLILLKRNDFTPEGKGIITCGKLILKGEFCKQAGEMEYFYVKNVETATVNLHPEESEETTYSFEKSDAETTTNPAFAPIPLSLSVRCGVLKMTLGELQQLDTGSLILVDNVIPGEALLCHGDYSIAKGELVDVEGKLGFQVTNILSGSARSLREDS